MKNTHHLKLLFILAMLSPFFVYKDTALAASAKIAYQGQLREQGVPVTENKSMVFRIFTSSIGGTAAWASGNQTVTVISGLFRTLLEPTGINWENTLYLEVAVEGTTLSPREELTASPYAVNSQFLAGKSYTSASSAPSSPSVGDLWFNTGTGTLSVWSGASWDQISSGGSGGGTVTVESGDSVVEASASRIDFSGSFFTVTSGPSGEANVTLSPGAIVDANIAAGAAVALSKLEKDPSQTGTINTSTNPVDWTLLKSVPADFADGVDNLGGGQPAVEENDVSVDGAVNTFDFLGANFNVTSSPAGEANISLDGSSVTLRGNSFNGTNQLVLLDGSGNLPALNATNLTSLPAAQLSGTIPNASLDVASATKQGNTFNGVNQLVKLDGSGDLAITGWTTITQHLSGTANLSYGTLAVGACEELPITVTGAVAGDSVYAGLPATFAQDTAWQTWTAYVSANDTVTLRRCNVDGRLTGASLGALSSATVRADVWRH